MLTKVFEYTDTRFNTALYLNGPYSANPEDILELYIEWYNKDFAPEEKLPQIKFEYFKFICSFAPIDFYNDYLIKREQKKYL